MVKLHWKIVCIVCKSFKLKLHCKAWSIRRARYWMEAPSIGNICFNRIRTSPFVVLYFERKKNKRINLFVFFEHLLEEFGNMHLQYSNNKTMLVLFLCVKLKTLWFPEQKKKSLLKNRLMLQSNLLKHWRLKTLVFIAPVSILIKWLKCSSKWKASILRAKESLKSMLKPFELVLSTAFATHPLHEVFKIP